MSIKIRKINFIIVFLYLIIYNNLATAQTCTEQLSDLQYTLQSKKQGLLRYEKSAKNISFDYAPTRQFNEYLDFAYNHIQNKNRRATMPCPIETPTYRLLVDQNKRPTNATITDLIAPFELTQQSKKAVLLIHGLTDSPFTYHDLAAFYYQQGYTVRTILLPGHGTAADALSNVKAKQWQQTFEYAIERTLKDFDHVILGGYSTGAALIINYITTQPVNPKLAAVMLFSPATEPHNKNGWLSKWVDYIPFIDWIDKDADVDFAKYESFPFNAATAADEAMSAISLDKLKHRNMPNLPIFSAFSEVDTTIDNQATLALLNLLHNPAKRPANKLDRLVFYGNQATIPLDFARDYTISSPDCNKPLCKNIRGISHIAIPNAPSNPHYGVNGLYRNCGSYLGDESLYKQCKNNPKPNLGERTKANLKKYSPLQRLTFNPYFDELTSQMGLFIDAVEKQNE